MVNMIVAIILAGTVGFVAGHFITLGGEEPISEKEAVTGEEEPGPPALVIPRPKPAQSAKPEATTAPDTPATVQCQPGMPLEDQLSTLPLRDLRKLCEGAENNWTTKNLDGFAPTPRGEPETSQYRDGLAQSLKEALLTSVFWRGEGTINVGATVVQMDLLLEWSASESGPTGGPGGAPKPSTMVITPRQELCYTLSPLFLINGRAEGASSFGSCGNALRKRGDVYYISWSMASSRELGKYLSTILIPTPGPAAGLEYMTASSTEWLSLSNFRWQPSTAQEFINLRERYRKKLEERPR